MKFVQKRNDIIIKKRRFSKNRMSKKSQSKKDIWDKISNISGIFNLVASIIIGLVGLHFANSFKEREVRIAELEIGEKYANYLNGDNDFKRRAGLNALLSLENKDLAFFFAAEKPTDGIVEQLEESLNTMAESPRKERLKDSLIYAYASRAYIRMWESPNLSLSDSNKVLDLDTENNHINKRGLYFTSTSYMNRGIAFFELGDVSNADKDMKRSIEILPRNAFGWADIAVYYQKNKNIDKSRQISEMILQKITDETSKREIQDYIAKKISE
jgi:tetratricopeptide (TPR) repeat protein